MKLLLFGDTICPGPGTFCLWFPFQNPSALGVLAGKLWCGANAAACTHPGFCLASDPHRIPEAEATTPLLPVLEPDTVKTEAPMIHDTIP